MMVLYSEIFYEVIVSLSVPKKYYNIKWSSNGQKELDDLNCKKIADFFHCGGGAKNISNKYLKLNYFLKDGSVKRFVENYKFKAK